MPPFFSYLAAACAMEVFKLATSCANPLENYMVFNDSDGIYTYAYEPEKKDDCFSCCQKAKEIQISGDAKLKEFLDMLVQEPSYQLKNPGATTSISGNVLFIVIILRGFKKRYSTKE